MSRAARRAVIEEGLKTLRMPSVLRDYEQRARQAQDGQWDYEDYLWQLLEAELGDREARTVERRLRTARFPDRKTMEQLDFKALKGVSRPKLRELASCEYIDRGDDVVLVGPIGTGKTHIAIALGIEAAQRRRRVWFRKAADLVRDLLEARDQRELGRLQQRLQRVDLLVCDELGFVPEGGAGGASNRRCRRVTSEADTRRTRRSPRRPRRATIAVSPICTKGFAAFQTCC